MLSEKRTGTQNPTPTMLMSISPFVPPAERSSPKPSTFKELSHPSTAQQFDSSHSNHPSEQPQQQKPHSQPQSQCHHHGRNHSQASISFLPVSHSPQFTQVSRNTSQIHQQHQKAQSQHPRRESIDGGIVNDSLQIKSSATSKAANESVGPYLLGKTLGKGSSGQVKLARHRKTDEQVAIKIISKASLVNRAAVHRGIEREIAIMKLINHPHVIRLHDVYETEKELFLVMEYVSGGELFEYLVNKGKLEETEALRFFQQIITGLAFCHKRKICHRDLKPENLLLDDNHNVKIADFGMASLQPQGKLLETSCGSPHYASPEVVTGMKYDGASSDIWSCGIILYALLTGHLPFDDENIRQLLSKVKAGKFYMPQDISAGARDLISRMLTVNPKRRITMQGVMMHPWFRMVNPEHNTLREPEQSLGNRQPMRIEELDAEILRHMRWLFAPGPSHSDPDAKEVFDEEALLLEIQEKMVSDEGNMEKLFYHLLCQHKADLLENYIEEGSDIISDAPRRRADSFLNSTTYSVRSATPDFNHTTLSPRGSPLMSSISSTPTPLKGAEPKPLILDSQGVNSPSVSFQAGNGKQIRLGPSPLKMTSIDGSTTDSSSSSPKDINEKSFPSSASLHGSGSRRTSVDKDRIQAGVAMLANKDNGARGSDTFEESSRSTFSPKIAPVAISMQEILEQVNAAGNDQHISTGLPMTTNVKAHQELPVTSMSPLMATQLPPIRPMEVVNPAAEEEEKHASTVTANGDCISARQSIECQVLATQVSRISCSADSEHSSIEPAAVFLQHQPHPIPQYIVQPTNDNGPSSKLSSGEKLKSAVSALCGHRPVLQSLGTKTYTGSEGTSSIISTTPLSHMATKRPLFARLFDFKPQPLVLKSNVSVVEAQERVETILKSLFRSNIQIDPHKRSPYGVKCRFEGGVINGQQVKAVKFKVDISEKIELLQSGVSNSANSPSSSCAVSSSTVAAILTTAGSQENATSRSRSKHLSVASQSSDITMSGMSTSAYSSSNNNSNTDSIFKLGTSGSSLPYTSSSNNHSTMPISSGAPNSSNMSSTTQSPLGFSFNKKKSAEVLASRRASDGGTILSDAAAAVSSHFSNRKFPFHTPQKNRSQSERYRHSVHGMIPNPRHVAIGTSQIEPIKIVKVTLYQQQGANSTLRMIYGHLCATWDQPLFNGSDHQAPVASPMVVAPLTIVQKDMFHRTAKTQR
ncbi:hypothetical protein BX616_010973 [Lobosporangium transversale]|nr:hypothetical protein BX616_010973 [Lobosporangium transversale]